MSELKTNNIKPAGVPIAPINPQETKPNTEDISKDTLESPVANTQKSDEPTKPATTKHVVTYIGNGEFVDRCDHKWHNNHEQTYTDEEFSKRSDLQYMIQYGAMKHTTVTM